MARCVICGVKFKVSEARSEFNSRFPADMFYDVFPENNFCGTCAIGEAETSMNQGAAIDMMNGDLEYDDDFVKEWL